MGRDKGVLTQTDPEREGQWRPFGPESDRKGVFFAVQLSSPPVLSGSQRDPTGGGARWVGYSEGVCVLEDSV